jgi:transcriptional regulator with XRE-family HTH domain
MSTITTGKRVAAWREHLGLSQQELASRIEISRQAVRQIEEGKNGVKLTTIEAIAGVAGVSLHTFFGPLPKRRAA